MKDNTSGIDERSSDRGDKIFWNVADAARVTGLSENWFYQLSRRRKLPGATYFGRHLRIHVATFLEAAESGLLSLDGETD